MSEPRQKAKPTLEELLRLKRAERPDAQFWAGFERELRQKQLTALVEKPRWWHGLAGLGRRAYLPAGAAAVVAFSLVAVRYNTPARFVAVENSAPRIEAADPAVEMLPATVVAATYNHHEEPVAQAVQPAEQADAQPVMVAARDEISPSARSIAANLARLEQAEPELLNAVLGSRLSSSARVQHASFASDAEPVANASVPTPRYRLIARYADRALSPEPSAPVLVREKLARRLGDDLGDDVSRIGVGGNRVSLKF